MIRTFASSLAWRAWMTSTDWATYPILGFSGVPQMECVLLDRPDQPAWQQGSRRRP